MNYLIAKFYEFLIKIKAKKSNYEITKFEYSILIGRGFEEKYVKPGSKTRITIYYMPVYYSNILKVKIRHKTFKSIKEAYRKLFWL